MWIWRKQQHVPYEVFVKDCWGALRQGSGMLIRIAHETDAPVLARVIVETARVAHRGMVPDEVLLKSSFADACAESERNWRRTLREIAAETDPQQQIFVAEDELGTVVGLAMGAPRRTEASPQTGEVYVLYVLQSHQRCGVGHALVTEIETT